MSTLKIGDPITHLFLRLHKGVLHGRVVEVAAPLFRIEDQFGFTSHRFRHEGVLWIRGHHTEDSDEVRALRAARALLVTG